MIPVSNLDELKKINDVTFVMWCYWSGNKMSKNRKLSFNMLLKNIGVPVFLITKENINQIEKTGYPFHKSFEYLSDVHKSDYIRIYLLHHYGGGWHDVKATEVDFKDVWSIFSNKDVYMIGRPEREGGPATVFDNKKRWMPDYWRDLISVTSWVGRSHTDLSESMFYQIEKLLDDNYEELRKYPAKHSREKKVVSKTRIGSLIIKLKNIFTGRRTNYPLPWTVYGNIFHPLNYKFRDYIARTLPKDEVKNAGVYHR